MFYRYNKRLAGLIFLFSISAFAADSVFSIDPKVGASIAVSSFQNMMSAPPLPRLDGGKKWEFPVSYNWLSAKIDIKDADNPDATQRGKASGNSWSVGAISKDYGGLRYFGWYMGNSFSGSMTLTASGAGGSAEIPNLKAKGSGGVAGASYRIIGEPKSPFALGAFGGLTYLRFSSSYRVDTIPAGAGPSLYYTYSPVIAGYLAGAQLNLKLGSFLMNPYYLYFKDVGQQCNAGGFSGCVSGTFSAGGVNLGYAGLVVTAYSAVLKSQSFSGIKTQAYGVSYTFGFEM